MAHLPTFLSIAFGATRPLAVWFFHEAASNSWRVPSLLGLWLLQSLVALRGFYLVTDSWPPRLLLVLLPSVLAIATLFLTTAGRRFLDGLQLDRLTLLHLVRIPVELVLWRLFLHRAVPQLMTFEGRNWDILLGLSAPIIYHLVFRGKQMGWRGLLAWNFLGLLSLLNIVVNAALATPSVVQRFAFNQPNVAILHFPFIMLPACVVPLVALAHLVAIRSLLRKYAAAGVPPHCSASFPALPAP